jgi:hypothetical protein
MADLRTCKAPLETFLVTGGRLFQRKARLLRSAKSSNVTSTMAVLGLIIISVLMVLVLNSSSLVNPVSPPTGPPPNSPGGPTGTLVLYLVSNTNESNPISNPTDGQIPISGLAAIVSLVTNSSSTPLTQPQLMTTAKDGIATRPFPPGSYLIRFPIEALNVQVPVHVSAGNQTVVNIAVFGTAYQLLYSEESNVVPTNVGVRMSMYAEVGASSSVANDSEQVILKMHEGTGVGGYLLNATVVSQQPPAAGKEWLEMGASSALNPVNVTSIYLTTWRYISLVTVGPEGLSGATGATPATNG